MALRPDDRSLSELTHDALNLLREIAGAKGVSCAAVGLAWVLGHADCGAPVIGPSRHRPHLSHVSEAQTLQLNEGERAGLERAFGDAAAE